MSGNKILYQNAQRLGVTDASVIQKAESFLRVLNSKSTFKAVTDLANSILCLDLAASNSCAQFDKETALKLTNLRKGVYHKALYNLEKALGLDRPLTISELCVQLSCTEVKDLAERILIAYGQTDKKIKDMCHPQYAAVSTYTACKLSGVKVDHLKLTSLSHLTTSQWKELVEEFAKFVKTTELISPGKESEKKKTNEVNFKDNKNSGTFSFSVEKQGDERDDECSIEEYEVWRDRILQEATAQILKSVQD